LQGALVALEPKPTRTQAHSNSSRPSSATNTTSLAG
jgi:hypothetical protein